MKFVDEAIITVRSGRGGDGLVSFRREKYVPHGGPDGGDGGRGGDVILVADPGLKTLLDFHYRRHHKAGSGDPGGRNNRTGKGGDDVTLKVPVGTVVTDTATGEVLADFVEAGQAVVMCKGGGHGRGNARFALPWRQVPDFATPGRDGRERVIRLELKLLADIGLVGLPNAGKSTLINRISAAKAKVADYPFTTIVPNLGVVQAGGPDRTFVVADLPGLIEGAAQGAGLGLQFLRHVERTRALVHLVDASSPDPAEALAVVERELAGYGTGLASKPVVVVASKADLPGSEAGIDALRAAATERRAPFLAISALTGLGVRELVGRMATLAAAPAPSEMTGPGTEPQRRGGSGR